MKSLFLFAAVCTVLTSCMATNDLRNGDSIYARPQFYEKYLNTGSETDARIADTLAALRTDPRSPELHNTLGSLLMEKGFPQDAEREFERAVNADGRYFPAWYNLGLVRASRGDDLGARRAFNRTVDLKPGHAVALFQLALIEEKRDHIDRAIGLYAKALTINPALLDVRVNPRILDSRLTHLALLKMYPGAQTRGTMQFQESGVPVNAGVGSTAEPAASPQADPRDIVTPSAPATEPAMQSPPAAPRPPPPAPPQARPTEALPFEEPPPATSTAPPPA